MKSLNSIKAILLTAAIICTPLSYANTSTPTDAEIVSAIESKFAADKMTSDLKINVSSKSGVVTLSGKVNTEEEADKLIQLAESTSGVSDVESTHLMDKKSKHIMADTSITAKVKGLYIREKLFSDKDISVTGVHIETTNGIVYLSGAVTTQAEIDNAIKLAKSVKGVKSVESKLTIKP